jgi:hypothetical protein
MYKIQYFLPNNIVLIINIDKFEPNPILVNINKFKPYRYLGKAFRRLEVTIEGGGKLTRRTQRTRTRRIQRTRTWRTRKIQRTRTWRTGRIHKNVFGMVLPNMKLHQKAQSIKKI